MKRDPRLSQKADVHEQWVGLSYVEQRGLPNYPPPRVENPRVDYVRATGSERPNEWGDIA